MQNKQNHLRKIDAIIIHCSSTAEDVDYTEKQLERDHLARGIRSPMGYHYYVRKDGREVLGRPISQIGAHASGHNKNTIGICYEGGLKAGGSTWRDAKDTRTVNQKGTILHIINKVLLELKKHQDVSKIKIMGHRDLGANKECPCFDAKAEYSWITA